MSTRLFVYGLLRKGDEMANLMSGAKALGEVQVHGYDLFDLGDYPGAVPGEGSVTGELYELPGPEAFEVLDRAERCFDTPPLYRRQVVKAGPKLAWMYIYARSTDHAPRIESGDWFDR